MSIPADILKRIESYCAAEEISERRFGYLAVDDYRWVGRLREGQVQYRLIERAEAYMLAYPPAMKRRG